MYKLLLIIKSSCSVSMQLCQQFKQGLFLLSCVLLGITSSKQFLCR